MPENVRIIFASDLHGSNACFRKLLETAVAEKADVVAVGGDVSGKSLTFVKRVSSRVYETKVAGRTERVNLGEELIQLENDISDSGSYPVRVEPDWLEGVDEKVETAIALVEIKNRLCNWMWWARETLSSRKIRLLFICGNDDPWELDDIIRDSGFAENPEDGIVTVGGHEFSGESRANKTPFGCPRDVSEIDLEERLRSRIGQLRDPAQAVFIWHTPPKNCELDSAPALDDQRKIKYTGAHPETVAAGSETVRKLIVEFQPLLTLHGHIHESPGFTRLGRTLSCNPGSDYSTGMLRAVLIDIQGDRIANHRRVER